MSEEEAEDLIIKIIKKVIGEREFKIELDREGIVFIHRGRKE